MNCFEKIYGFEAEMLHYELHLMIYHIFILKKKPLKKFINYFLHCPYTCIW